MIKHSNTRVITIGLSGPSSGGKTTISRYLKSILPNSTIVHQDDFYRPENQLPLDPKTGQPNWDCPEAIDFDGLIATLTHVKELGYFPEDFNSLEDKNPVGSKEFSTPIPQQDLDRMRDMILGSNNRHLDITRTKFVILDGFILYVNAVLRETIDIKFFVTAPYQVLKERRESRKGYATLEGYWEDPPGYFDGVVWPNYLIYNGPLVKLADAIEAGQDSGIYCSNTSSRTDPMIAKIDVVSSGNISIHAMVHSVSELVAKRLTEIPLTP